MKVSINGMRRNMHIEMMELKEAIEGFEEWYNGGAYLSPIETVNQVKEKFDAVACSINCFQCCYDESQQDDFDDQGEKYNIPIFSEDD